MRFLAGFLVCILGAHAVESRATYVAGVLSVDEFLNLTIGEYIAMTDTLLIADISPVCSAGLNAMKATSKILPLVCAAVGSAPIETTTENSVEITTTEEVSIIGEIVESESSTLTSLNTIEASATDTTVNTTIVYNGTGIESIINRATFEELFSLRFNAEACQKGVDVLTYDNFATAINYYYPEMVVNNGTRDQKYRNVAAFLAQMSQETSGRGEGDPYLWGLCFIEELICDESCPQYTDEGSWEYPPVPGVSYHGRGPIQISWNYNYGLLSEALFDHKEILLNKPEMLVTDGVVAFRSALWFWTTQQWAKPSCFDIMMETAPPCQHAGRVPGFGWTTNVINGGLECGIETPQKVENRVQYYLSITSALDVDPGKYLYCDEMANYSTDFDCPAPETTQDSLAQ
ncbi:hypothetical protein SARC_00624 [Sphaeroforma arctica JP610]|uniref:Glycoside hydrolase family 19 catalytic domain-containing protein n=1 Tax=Sphaeroforma arctica JP610 TaxID=667725 RepID=A0A0L0GG29_9EUKA|nr:hypothetical protein SARC_00624 [Sphaeroforma arctica JP610]KNC87238.1 hypothetical protein SARC_00624 [Sphaeroforma arctica JP610]|eukprot:XP_014161140.1 hypothetical protein SARC_00624 [Sphaeroforma arctica JP610]